MRDDRSGRLVCVQLRGDLFEERQPNKADHGAHVCLGGVRLDQWHRDRHQCVQSKYDRQQLWRLRARCLERMLVRVELLRLRLAHPFDGRLHLQREWHLRVVDANRYRYRGLRTQCRGRYLWRRDGWQLVGMLLRERVRQHRVTHSLGDDADVHQRLVYFADVD